ncbi:MAG: dTDP-4-amino-4,6-dideoxyglucose formyltransferase [Chitinophagaceae bacterium]
MFKNILVISDHVLMCKKFLEIVKAKKISIENISFAISPFSKKENFQISEEVEILVLDLKNKDDVEIIKKNYDLVFSIHCKQIFPADLINEVKCINVHPGYNPINRGWFPQVFSILNKVQTGATIHEIDGEIDHGGIIAREFVNKEIFDTSKSLYTKIVEKEIELLDAWLEKIINNEYSVTLPGEEGNLYFKKDYKKLLEIDLKEKISAGDFIDRLRALSHEGFDNAYFLDPGSGKKIYVEIRLKPGQ